ncbi:MAG: anthranilate synthase component I family protein [Deltaproteobacteria bacterium]|nr:anthranilate synthase component I family protein [Deltaproteobacteria bacterium]
MSQVSALEVRELTAVPELLACFEAFRALPCPWLLDSGAAPGAPKPQVARYSFMGADPYLVLRSRGTISEIEFRRPVVPMPGLGRQEICGDPFEIMRSLLPPVPDLSGVISEFDASPPFLGGAVGYLGYELGESCEPVSLSARDDFGLADLVLLFVDRLLVIDHVARRAFAVGIGFADAERTDEADAQARSRAVDAAESIERLAVTVDGETDVAPVRAEVDRLNRRELLGSPLPADAKAGFDARDYAAAVSSETSDAELGWRLYRSLRRLSPAPFAAYLELPEVTIASSSPERFLSLSRDGRAESRPIKGTRRRGVSEEEDTLLAKELAVSQKDRAENLMIVDLVRNDLGRVCETGSIEVPELMAIEHYATVFQMVSTVRGTLREECDVVDLLRATFPPGSMTGAPKIAAMQIIDRIEPVRRGIYSGAIGYFDIAGGLDLSVVIRTLLVRNGEVHLHSGGAVVSDSDPQDEYRESLDKIRALLAAIEDSP